MRTWPTIATAISLAALTAFPIHTAIGANSQLTVHGSGHPSCMARQPKPRNGGSRHTQRRACPGSKTVSAPPSIAPQPAASSLAGDRSTPVLTTRSDPPTATPVVPTLRFTLTHGNGFDEVFDGLTGVRVRTSRYDVHLPDNFAAVSTCPLATIPTSFPYNPFTCMNLFLTESIVNDGPNTICPEPCATPIGGAISAAIDVNAEPASGTPTSATDGEGNTGISPYDAPNATWCENGCPLQPLTPQQFHGGTRAYWLPRTASTYDVEAEIGGTCPAEVTYARFKVSIDEDLGLITVTPLAVPVPTQTLNSCGSAPEAIVIPTNGPAPGPGPETTCVPIEGDGDSDDAGHAPPASDFDGCP